MGRFSGWREEEGFAGSFEQGEARRYLLSRYRSGKKWQTVNGDYSAMRKFYEHVPGQKWDVEHLPRSRKELALPGILSTEEVGWLIPTGVRLSCRWSTPKASTLHTQPQKTAGRYCLAGVKTLHCSVKQKERGKCVSLQCLFGGGALGANLPACQIYFGLR